MKTSIKTIILSAAAIFAAMSCQKEESVPGAQDKVNAGETIHVSIDASLGDLVAAEGTKATAEQVVRLLWEEGDKVDAYCGTTKLNSNPITVTPSDNKLFATLTGTITAPEAGETITFVYSNVNSEQGNELAFDFSDQSTSDIPFVAYATLVYDETAMSVDGGTATFTDKMVEFKFATSVMKIAATNLGGGAISGATISGINTKVTLTPNDRGDCGIAGSENASITTTNYDASSDGTRAIVTVGLVPDNTSSPYRTLTVSQTGYTNKGVITSGEIESSTSYTTPAALFTCGSLEGHDYVLIAGTKWATQNLYVTVSGEKAWKGKNTTTVKVPGTDKDVVVGDYFQWAASYAGYNIPSDPQKKNLLLYTSFGNKKCGDTDDKFYTGDGDFSKTFNLANAPYGGTSYTQYTSTTGTMNLGKTDDVANIILGGDWRMPTSAEFNAMREATYWAWDGTDCGYYVFMPGLGTSGTANVRGTINADTDDKTKALLFFPAAGYGTSTALDYAGTFGRYWSSSLYSSNPDYAYNLFFHSGNVNPQNSDNRYHGYSVRPVSD